MSNVFSFTGTVGKDAEVRQLPSGQAVLSVNVANDVGWGEKKQTLWVRVALWGKRAEGEFKNFLVKGQQVFVSGELTMSEYTANDGTKKTQLELNASVLDLVGKREEKTSNHYERPVPTISSQVNHGDDCCTLFGGSGISQPTNNGLKYPENGAPYDDDDIPF